MICESCQYFIAQNKCSKRYGKIFIDGNTPACAFYAEKLTGWVADAPIHEKEKRDD